MGSVTVPSNAGKTRYLVNLTSGTSWTVPSGVTYVNAKLIGGGGAGSGQSSATSIAYPGLGGQTITSTVTTTPGASITYAIGAGGAGAAGTIGGAGGTTTFTGATSALGGNGGGATTTGTAGQAGSVFPNGGGIGIYAGSNATGGAGGAGLIEIEYWV